MRRQHVFISNLFKWFASRGYTPTKGLRVFAPDFSDNKRREMIRKLTQGTMYENDYKAWEMIKRRITRNEAKGKIGNTTKAK
jgi:hypothetical protein